ncbi:MAG: AAA family ATPase [Desulfobaccales bacterium]
MAKKVSIINFKGGVGKTTLSLHLSTYLARENRVLVIDVDHQSSLSIVMLGGKLWERCSNDRETINRIFESFCNRNVQMPGHEIISSNPFHARSRRYDYYPNLDLVPAQFELDDTEIELASTTIGGPTLSEWEKRTLLASWLDAVDADENYDYIIYDCPPATKLVSQNALAASDCFIIPVIPDEMSTRGVTHFLNLVRNKIDAKLKFLHDAASISVQDTPKSYVADTKAACIVPFMAKTAGAAHSGLTNLHTRKIRELRRQWGDLVLKPIVKNLSGVPESIDLGWPVWHSGAPNASQDVINMMKSVCREITENRI